MNQNTGGNPGGDPKALSSTSTTLLDGVKAADPIAWEKMAHLYGPLIYRWCRLSGLQDTDAGDVAQEVFTVVADKIGQFRRDRPGDSFRGWLWGITRNKLGDFFRRLQRQPQAQGGTDAQQRLAELPDQPPVDSKSLNDPDGLRGVELRAIELARAGVEDRTWKAFQRVAVDGQPVVEIADELGMNVKAVYEAKYRVLRRVRNELGGLV